MAVPSARLHGGGLSDALDVWATAGGRRASESPSTSEVEVEIAAWRAAAITALTAWALVFIAGSVVLYWHRRLKPKESEVNGTLVGDAERCEARAVALTSKDPDKQKLNGAFLNSEVTDEMRELLQEHLSRGLQTSGISGRLEELQRLLEEQGTRSEKELRDGPKLNGAMQPLVGSDFSSDGEVEVPKSPPNLPAGRPTPPAGEPPLMSSKRCRYRDAGVGTDPEFLADFGQSPTRRRQSGCVLNAAFGPTSRQLRLTEPPEKAQMHTEEKSSLKMSLATVQRHLDRRDSQAQELRRQIQECEQAMEEQKADAETAVTRLQELREDPSRALNMQVEEIRTMQSTKVQMADRLDVAKTAERYWSQLAKRQRAFFMQNERLAQEGALPLRHHPAGEIFLELPPVALEGDDDAMKKPPWDVGTLVMNPYATDSWPFEPNVLAQRLAVEPNLSRWDEVDEELIAVESEDDAVDEEYDEGFSSPEQERDFRGADGAEGDDDRDSEPQSTSGGETSGGSPCPASPLGSPAVALVGGSQTARSL